MGPAFTGRATLDQLGGSLINRGLSLLSSPYTYHIYKAVDLVGGKCTQPSVVSQR